MRTCAWAVNFDQRDGAIGDLASGAAFSVVPLMGIGSGFRRGARRY